MLEDKEKGFRLVMKKFGEPLYWHIRRLVVSHADAQDAEQNTFIKVFRSFETLKSPESLTAWIYRIATNEAMTIVSKDKRPRQIFEKIDGKETAIAAEPYTDYSDLEAVKLQRAILSLPPKQQIAFNLRYYDEMEYAKIAEVTESTVSTVKVNYHLAKEKIIKFMNSND